MIKGERLVREDGKFELLIERNDDLVCRSIIRDKDLEHLNQSELIDLENQQLRRLVFSRINSIWLHKSHCVLYRNDGRIIMLKNFYDKSPMYTLSIDYSNTPSYLISEATNN